MFALLTQLRLRLLGHVRRMEDWHLPKVRPACDWHATCGSPSPMYKDACNIYFKDVETLVEERTAWR
ncbi:hypothetical protein DPMN_025509 [Dreissena polymorpha]|uniref:Uncharacterized protein n=1 Tax=Dreissena polymorpha TaxID=45954 RepID=A0A9D4LRM3_DREPO|nr:hypothetical protein DPMN_025509 [Dreissena polymorpha]